MGTKTSIKCARLLGVSTLLLVTFGCVSGDNFDASDGGPDREVGFLGDGSLNPMDDRFVPDPTDSGRPGADGSRPGTDMGGRPPVRIPIPADLPQTIAQTICAYFDRCRYTPLVETFMNEPCAQFMERQFQDLTVARLSPLVDGGDIIYDPQGTRACLTTIGALQCSPDFTALATACVDSFVGQVPTGGPCSEHEACQGAMFCDSQSGCPGRCADRITIGQTCQDTGACQVGLTCVNGACSGPAAGGQACGGQGPACDAGLYCDGENGGAGQCRTLNTQLAGQGAPCEIQGGPFCQDGLACIVQIVGLAAQFSCQPRVGDGERCAPGLPDHCQAGYFCNGTDIDGFPPDIEGRCRPLPNEGEPCGDAPAFKVCAAGLVCDSNTCRARGRIGGPCGQDETCYSGRCRQGACVVSALCTP